MKVSRYVIDHDPDETRPYVLDSRGMPRRRAAGFTVNDLQPDPQGEQPETQGRPSGAGDEPAAVPGNRPESRPLRSRKHGKSGISSQGADEGSPARTARRQGSSRVG